MALVADRGFRRNLGTGKSLSFVRAQDMTETIWVFHGAGARFSSGVFSSLEQAQSWIEHNRLSGLLTEYPLNIGAYEWAVGGGHFTPAKPEHSSPEFVGAFTSGSQPHFHYENGFRA